MRILVVAGTRPQFVKAAPLLSAIAAAGHRSIFVNTGQHYEVLSDPFFADLALPEPDVDLRVGSAPRSEQIGAMERGLLGAIETMQRPDWVVVPGDTNSALAGALAARAATVRLAHVEAGLRSFDDSMPEEANRVLTDRMADALLCPSRHAAANLRAEGLNEGVEVVGDVMRDALESGLRVQRPTLLADLGLVAGRYVLASIHRAGNTDDAGRLAAILEGLGEIADPVVLPLHPRTATAIERADLEVPPGVRVLEPVGYVDSIALVAGARVVATDSGGLQKEAYWMGVPCVTLRESTEWVETVEAGWNVLVGADPAAIAAAVADAVPGPGRADLYGLPGAADRCVEVLERFS